MRELNFKFFTLCGINKYKVEGFNGKKKKSGGRGGEREVTEKARRERGHWRGGDWSRASRGWVEHRRIGTAIRSCPGPVSRALRTPIPPTVHTASSRSFFFLSPAKRLRSEW